MGIENTLISQYQTGVQGFGAASEEELQQLHKALTVGNQNPPLSGGNVLRVESLESTLRIVSFQMEHIRFWKLIPKIGEISTVAEYNRLLSYGNQGGAFFNEGGLPRTEDTNYERKTALVKFLGTTREVSHVSTVITSNHGDIISLETRNGTVWLLQQMENALFNADSSVIPLEFDGMDVQITSGAPQNVISLEGNILTENDVEQAANLISESFGIATHLHIGVRALSDFSQAFYAKGRFGYPAEGATTVGFALDAFKSSAGKILFEPNVFIKEGPVVPSSASNAESPSTPGITSAVGVSDSTSKLPAATYVYSVTGVNESGESQPVTSSDTVVAVNEHALITVTDGGGGTTGFRFYRRLSTDAVGSERFYFQQPVGSLTNIDRNFDIPGTSRAYLVQGNIDFYAFKQLSPMVRIPLATIAASYRWLQLIYGVPIIYKPNRGVVFKNIGSAQTTIAPTGFETTGV